MKKSVISIVSPVYKSEKIVSELLARIISSVEKITSDFEIILVEDGSPDNSWEEIEKACHFDKRIKGIKLSRNFGQHYAITAGLNYVNSQWVVVMDCDLQDLPEEINNLYEKALEGYEIVLARRDDRKDSIFKKMSSKMFHKLYSYLSGYVSDSSISNFGIYNYRVINEFNKLNEVARSFPSLVNFLGFKSVSINVKHSERFEGKSSYTFSKLMKLSLDVILSNSNKPLRITIKLGFLISFISFLMAIYNLIAHYLGVIKVPGFTTTIFSIWFVGGLNTFVLGIVGLYLGKIFDQVKNRQLYVVSKKININLNEEN
jgi:glycosyltransferase involved in cell wall biosynthesis